MASSDMLIHDGHLARNFFIILECLELNLVKSAADSIIHFSNVAAHASVQYIRSSQNRSKCNIQFQVSAEIFMNMQIFVQKGAQFKVVGPSFMRFFLLHIHKHLSDLSHISLRSNGVCKNIVDGEACACGKQTDDVTLATFIPGINICISQTNRKWIYMCIKWVVIDNSDEKKKRFKLIF